MRVACLVLVLVLGQLLAAQTPESAGITIAGRVLPESRFHELVLSPETASPGPPKTGEIALDGTFTIEGLAFARYRLSLVPPVEPGAEIPRIEIRGLSGAELVIYDKDHRDEAVIAQPGLSERRELFAGTIAPLGAFGVGVRIESFNPSGGGTNARVKAYRALILEFRSTTRQPETQADEETDVPR